MGAPIRAFVGPNGSGKTLAAVELVIGPALADGRRVVSNCVINHPNFTPLRSWIQLNNIHDCVLMLDEISRVVPSRAAMQIPPQLIGILDQLRKVDVEVIWTAPAWGRADSILRSVTQEVTSCRGYVKDVYPRMPGEVPPWYKPFAGRDVLAGSVKRSRRWVPNSFFVWKSYDAQAFEEFSVHAVKDIRPLSKVFYWRPWHRAQFMYDTIEPVLMLDNISDIGVCVNCGGTRTRPRCICPRGPVVRASVGGPLGPNAGTHEGLEVGSDAEIKGGYEL